jgi:hypothetical protein
MSGNLQAARVPTAGDISTIVRHFYGRVRPGALALFWGADHETTPTSASGRYWLRGNRRRQTRHRAIDATTKVAADIKLSQVARHAITHPIQLMTLG